MDLQTLQARALAAREVTHTVGEITYRLRVPTRHDVLLAAQRTGAMQAAGDRAAMLVMQRALLDAAVVGWAGVRVHHVLPPDRAAPKLARRWPGSLAPCRCCWTRGPTMPRPWPT